MKVGLVSTLERGGPVEHTVTLASGLAAAGVEVRAVCATPAIAARLEAAGTRATVAPLRHQLDVAGARRVRRALAGVDVVHAQDRRAGLWTRLLPPARRGWSSSPSTGCPSRTCRRPPAASGPACARGSPTGASTRCWPAARTR